MLLLLSMTQHNMKNEEQEKEKTLSNQVEKEEREKNINFSSAFFSHFSYCNVKLDGCCFVYFQETKR